jgi:hypothetical protein
VSIKVPFLTILLAPVSPDLGVVVVVAVSMALKVPVPGPNPATTVGSIELQKLH